MPSQPSTSCLVVCLACSLLVALIVLAALAITVVLLITAPSQHHAAPTAAPHLRADMAPNVAEYMSRSPPLESAAAWALPDENKKRGAGVLLFAYGDPKTLGNFLQEATWAARALKQHNPTLQIAVVTNNASIDGDAFSHHIQPRSDLLFRGSACPYEKNATKAKACNGMPRQWATRLYYMALSPFVITWALDSNVMSCTPGAASGFLDAAASSSPPLWGFDIVQANGGGGFYPHNWNILYAWNPRTSAMMRDWFMLQLRRGITTDDQSTLFAAEQRGRTHGLRLGQMPTPYAAAFYSVEPKNGFFPRLSRPLHDRAHVLHCKQRNGQCAPWCNAFARAAARGTNRWELRSRLPKFAGRSAHWSTTQMSGPEATSWQLYIGTKEQELSPSPLWNPRLCARELRMNHCPLRADDLHASDVQPFAPPHIPDPAKLNLTRLGW